MNSMAFLATILMVGLVVAAPMDDDMSKSDPAAKMDGMDMMVKPKGQCDPENADECTRDLMSFWDDSHPIPKTEAEVSAVCDQVKNGSRCIRNYFKQCATPTMKEMFKVLVGGVNKGINKHCSPQGIKVYLEHSRCAEDARIPVKQCVKQAVRDLYTVRSANKTSWHSLACCYASRAYQCSTNAIQKNCNEKSQEYLKDEITSLVSELSDTFCQADALWGTKKCAMITIDLPQPVMPKGRRPTILPVVLEIVSEISDAEAAEDEDEE